MFHFDIKNSWDSVRISNRELISDEEFRKKISWSTAVSFCDRQISLCFYRFKFIRGAFSKEKKVEKNYLSAISYRKLFFSQFSKVEF